MVFLSAAADAQASYHVVPSARCCLASHCFHGSLVPHGPRVGASLAQGSRARGYQC